jgi:hypothetical protein
VADDEAVELPASPRAPGLARAHVRALLSQWGLTRLCDEVLLLTTEVVTNALMHTGGASRLRVERVGAGRAGHGRRQLAGAAGRAAPSASATTGRGCRLLTELADSWTAVPRDGGKSVVFVVGGQRDPVGRARRRAARGAS